MKKIFKYFIYKLIKNGSLNELAAKLFFIFPFFFYKNRKFYYFLAIKNKQKTTINILFNYLDITDFELHKILLYCAEKNNTEFFLLFLNKIKNKKNIDNKSFFLYYNQSIFYAIKNNNKDILTSLINAKIIDFKKDPLDGFFKEEHFNVINQDNIDLIFYVLEKIELENENYTLSLFFRDFFEKNQNLYILKKYYPYYKRNLKKNGYNVFKYHSLSAADNNNVELFKFLYEEVKDLYKSKEVFLILLDLIRNKSYDLFELVFTQKINIVRYGEKISIVEDAVKCIDSNPKFTTLLFKDSETKTIIKEVFPDVYKNITIKNKVINF